LIVVDMLLELKRCELLPIGIVRVWFKFRQSSMQSRPCQQSILRQWSLCLWTSDVFSWQFQGRCWDTEACWYGASLDGSLCNTSKMYIQQVQMTSHKSENAQKAQTTWQTTSPWCWSRSPLQRRGFDEPMPPEGWAALHMFVPRPPLKRFNRFNKLK
jgi:hypothetical protein